MKYLTALLLASLILIACKTSEKMPSTLQGSWISAPKKITVRTYTRGYGYDFTEVQADAELVIHEDQTASGRIGQARFEKAPVRKNSGNPKITGVTYVIACGQLGKIAPGDPLDTKEIELWLGIPGDSITCELRYTEKMAVFPMGDFTFVRKK